MNPYVYAGNDPVNAFDPGGLCPLESVYSFINSFFSMGFTCSGGGGGLVPSVGDLNVTVAPTWPEEELGPKSQAKKASFDVPNDLSGGEAELPDVGRPGVSLPQVDTLKKAATEWAGCVNNHKFSSLFSNPTARKVVGFLEIGAPSNLLADLRAIRLKATRSGVAGPHGPGASGINRFIRNALGGSRTTRVITKVGGKASVALSVVGAFTAAYNGTIEAQCALGVIE